mmetsp:Transcript_13908/g.33601  ORF Transcript_13908/g.33601 Transcript_13908/m.33601 type:complete len:606 (+) Transcript_13908:97-1914(+)
MGDSDQKLASLAKPEHFLLESIKHIDSGPVDYVIRCTKGLFCGRFLYVNRTPAGELFGSDQNARDITMYIESAKVSPRHAEIKFKGDTFQYFLRDVGSETGTWVKVRKNRSMEVGPGQELLMGDTLVRILEGPPVQADKEVEEWARLYQLEDTPVLEALRNHGVNTFEQLLDPSLPDLNLSPEHQATFEQSLSEFSHMFSTNYPRHSLLFQPVSSTQDQQIKVTWSGGTILCSPEGSDDVPHDPPATSKDRVLGNVDIVGAEWIEPQAIRVGYSYGRYYVHLSKSSPDVPQKCWARLRVSQAHWLQPDDVFQIGALEFTVLRFNVGCHGEPGYRPSMEDEEIVVQDLATSNYRHCSFIGVFDGHGGRACATYVRDKLHMNFVEALHDRGGLDRSTSVHHDIFDSVQEAFRNTDQGFKKQYEDHGFGAGSGCVAVCLFICGGWLWCANCGDARGVLCRSGEAIELSVDHKPDRPDETKRIEAAGGFVSFGRVLGRLAVSRAFGDTEYKTASAGHQPLVSVEPEIRTEKLRAGDEFVLLACDGLFDVFSSQEAVDFVRDRLASMPPKEQDPQKVVEELVREAIEGKHSRDNVTAIIVCFTRTIGVSE